MDENYIVFCNFNNEEEAKRIAKEIVDNLLGACVTVSASGTSYYKWEGKTVEESEFTIMVKTHSLKLNRLIDWLKENHSYDVPEIIAFEIAGGDPEYLKWIKNEVGQV